MALKLAKKVYAAAAALILATTGVNVAINDAVLKDKTKDIIKAYIKTTDSAAYADNYATFSKFRYIKFKPDSAADSIQSYIPADCRYNPLYYTVPTDTFRIEVTSLRTDSVLRVMFVQSDSTGLLVVDARIQPSKNPADTTGK